jgi:hypothetical protein
MMKSNSSAVNRSAGQHGVDLAEDGFGVLRDDALNAKMVVLELHRAEPCSAIVESEN